MITTLNQINEEQLKQLERLGALCKKSDGSTPNLYTHILTKERTFPACALYYKQEELIGFISVFFFYDEAVEISLFIHPSFRKQGIAKELLHAIIPLIQFQNYSTLIFSSPSKLNDKWLLSCGYTYLHTEYYMERENLNPIFAPNARLTFRKANLEDLPYLCSLDELCFPHKHGDLPGRFQHLFQNREYELILAFHNNYLIGKAHIRWQSQGATLSDIAIMPKHQGKGYGSELIVHCINNALSEGKPIINLDVETHNQRALNLYLRLGFITKNACDFWSINIKQLLQIISS